MIDHNPRYTARPTLHLKPRQKTGSVGVAIDIGKAKSTHHKMSLSLPSPTSSKVSNCVPIIVKPQDSALLLVDSLNTTLVNHEREIDELEQTKREVKRTLTLLTHPVFHA